MGEYIHILKSRHVVGRAVEKPSQTQNANYMRHVGRGKGKPHLVNTKI